MYQKQHKAASTALLQRNRGSLASGFKQTLPPRSLPAREGWCIVVDARRAYAYSKVGTAACGRDGVAGLDLPGCSLLLRSFPHSHYSGSFAGSCVEDPYDVDIVCNGYGLLRICCLALELHRDLSRSLPPRPAERRAGEQLSTTVNSKISLSSDLHPHCKAPKNPFISLDVRRHRLKLQAPQQSLQTEFSARAPTPRRRVYLFSLNHIKLHGLSISYAAEVLPGVILLYGSLTT